MPSHQERIQRNYCEHVWPEMDRMIMFDFPDLPDGRKCIKCGQDWDKVHPRVKKMSSDAKIWKDGNGWHGICDAVPNEQFNGTDYELRNILVEIEQEMKTHLHWEIFEFKNGLGLRGYRAK